MPSYNLAILQDIINENFLTIIYDRINDYINNLSGDELFDIYNNVIDFTNCISISNPIVLMYETKEIKNQVEIEGEIELKADTIGYTFWNNTSETEHVSIPLKITFLFFDNNGSYEDFDIIDIFM